MKIKGAALTIKKEIQEFLIASEKVYRLLSDHKSLSCHEVEILRCCVEELSTMGDGLLLCCGREIKKDHGFE